MKGKRMVVSVSMSEDEYRYIKAAAAAARMTASAYLRKQGTRRQVLAGFLTHSDVNRITITKWEA